MDILRGKATEKVTQYGHDTLSTFGIGADFSEAQLRGVLRQLIATGAVAVDAERLQHPAADRRLARRAQGRDAGVMLRESVSQPAARERAAARAQRGHSAAAAGLARRRRAGALRRAQGLARRGGARAQPAGLCDLSRRHAGARSPSAAPQTLDDLQGISGIGDKKLEAYGARVLRVCAAWLQTVRAIDSSLQLSAAAHDDASHRFSTQCRALQEPAFGLALASRAAVLFTVLAAGHAPAGPAATPAQPQDAPRPDRRAHGRSRPAHCACRR